MTIFINRALFLLELSAVNVYGPNMCQFKNISYEFAIYDTRALFYIVHYIYM